MDEYDVLSKKFGMQCKKELKENFVGLVQVGSVARGDYIRGESDCNLVLCLDAKDDKQTMDLLEKAGNILYDFLKKPLYSSLLDLHIYFLSEIRESQTSGGYSINDVHLYSAKNGKVIEGKNPFAEVQVDMESVKHAAGIMMYDMFRELKDIVLTTIKEEDPEQDRDRLYYLIDVMLLFATYYLYSNGILDVSKASAPLYFEQNFSDVIDVKPLQRAQALRLASKEEKGQGLIQASLEFCYKLLSLKK